VLVYAVVDDALTPDFPLGVDLQVFIRREDTERFIEEVRGDDPDLASYLRNRGAGARGGRADPTRAWYEACTLHCRPGDGRCLWRGP
jgi:hypothetical protein